MIILGDYACVHSVDFQSISKEFGDEPLIINLEGAVIDEPAEKYLHQSVLFNTIDSVDSLSKMNVKLMNAANNHYFDLGNRCDYNAKILREKGINVIGAGNQLDEARKPIRLTEGEQDYAFISFCWNVTGGKYAKDKCAGVNPFTKSNIEHCVLQVKAIYPEAKIVLVVHWGIELEKYPEPMHIQLAKYAIDCGAEIVIGHHPHRIQPIERYNGKYIFYSIGNFLIEDKCYFNGRLDYPICSRDSLAVQITSGTLSCFVLNNENGRIRCIERLTIKEAEKRYKLRADQDNYGQWFKDNRVKRNVIPIYYNSEDHLFNLLKNGMLRLRGTAIKAMLFLKLKKGRRNSE